MIIYILILLLGNSYATDLKANKVRYADKNFGLEVIISDNDVATAKLYDAVVPLSMISDAYEGVITSSDITIHFLIKPLNKRRAEATVSVERTLPRNTGEQRYDFTDIGTKLLVKDDHIVSYTAEAEQELYSELELNDDGSIRIYNSVSGTPYTLNVISTSVVNFQCKSCSYQLMGKDNNSLLIMEVAYIKFSPRTINYYIVEGGTKTINTFDGTHLEIETTFYNKDKGGSLKSSTTSFSLLPDKLKMLTSSKFLLKKKHL